MMRTMRTWTKGIKAESRFTSHRPILTSFQSRRQSVPQLTSRTYWPICSIKRGTRDQPPAIHQWLDSRPKAKTQPICLSIQAQHFMIAAPSPQTHLARDPSIRRLTRLQLSSNLTKVQTSHFNCATSRTFLGKRRTL